MRRRVASQAESRSGTGAACAGRAALPGGRDPRPPSLRPGAARRGARGAAVSARGGGRGALGAGWGGRG